jgi:hypothetical protein
MFAMSRRRYEQNVNDSLTFRDRYATFAQTPNLVRMQQS